MQKQDSQSGIDVQRTISQQLSHSTTVLLHRVVHSVLADVAG